MKSGITQDMQLTRTLGCAELTELRVSAELRVSGETNNLENPFFAKTQSFAKMQSLWLEHHRDVLKADCLVRESEGALVLHFAGCSEKCAERCSRKPAANADAFDSDR